MQHILWTEIDKFKNWAILQPTDYGCWECDYEHWTAIYYALEDFIKLKRVDEWTPQDYEGINYILARDNELEDIANLIAEQDEILIRLTAFAIQSTESHAKWQLAIQLHQLKNRATAIELLEKLVQDENEYVNRRSLMELAKLNWDKIEMCCELFWNRNKYGEMDEYQKIMVLSALQCVNSPKLGQYLELAKQDGRQYLVLNALEISKGTQI